MKRFLVKHVGNMGDLVFFVTPVLAALKRHHPDCHITLITAWGFKKKSWRAWPAITRSSSGLPRLSRTERWGERNHDGFCIALMMTNPHIDQLVHWHDTKLALDGSICREEGRSFPTWNRRYFESRKSRYDGVFELDFGIAQDDNPVSRMYQAINLPDEDYSDYRLYLTKQDKYIASTIMSSAPRPRVVLLEALANPDKRGWDPAKAQHLEQAIHRRYKVSPRWFGARHVPHVRGRRLSLRENIATLTYCDVAIGPLSGPLHFAAAVGLPTLTLYCDQPLHRAAPAYFLNRYGQDAGRLHRTLLGPTSSRLQNLKGDHPSPNLTPAEVRTQQYRDWLQPGKQATKSCLAVITVDEVMLVLDDMLSAKRPDQP